MINKETILLKTNNGLEVFRHFIPANWQLGKNFLNPFYQDKKASCNVYLDSRSGMYKIKDFGDDKFVGDCFAFVATLFDLDCRYKSDFLRVMQIIDQELSLGLNDQGFEMPPKVKFSKKPNTATTVAKAEAPEFVPPKYKAFSKMDLEFWGQYGIRQNTLELFQVVCIESFTAENKEGKSYTVVSSVREPIYGYRHLHFVKVYRPFSLVRFLYLGKKSDTYIFGLEQLPAKGDVLFVTGGEKDVMTLSAHRFHAISFNSETAHIPLEVIKKLSFRFKHIILLYDMDLTGYEASAKHCEELKDFDVKRMLLPLEGTKDNKDVSDYFREGNSREQFKRIFLDLLENLYAETFAMLKSCEIDFKNPPVTPEPLITINSVIIGSPGNILCITGSEGSGKSNYMGSVVAGAMKLEDHFVDSLGTEVVVNEAGQAILYYDTEQSEDQLYRNLTYILRRCHREEPPKWFRAYCLTNMSRRERLHVIVQSMDKFHHQYNGIHMVVIDGIGDLIKGLNDEVESVQLVEELHRLAGIYRTCIISVLHLLPSGLKLRGHLGSEIQRKAAGILSIEKDSDTDISTIKALKVRSGSPLDVPLMQFQWDKERNYHVFIGERSKEDKEQRKFEDLEAMATELYAEKEQYSYQELWTVICESTDVSERTAKSYIKFMKDRAIIKRHPTKATHYLKGEFPV